MIWSRASAAEAEYGLRLSPLAAFTALDALIVAVPHAAYRRDRRSLPDMVRSGGAIVDVKGILAPGEIRQDIVYWSL